MAIFENFQLADPQYRYAERLYRAVSPDNDYESGHVLQALATIDVASGQTVRSDWHNVTTGKDIPAPNIENLHAYDGHRVLLSSEQVSYEAEPVSLQSIPKEANHAEVHIWHRVTNAYSIITLDGTAPDPNVGFRQKDGATFELESLDELNGFQIKSNEGPSQLHVQYFYQSKRNA